MTDCCINVFGKGVLKYVFDCVAKFNRGVEQLTIKGSGGNVTNCIETAYILQREFGTKIHETRIKSFQINNIEMPFIEIDIMRTDEIGEAGTDGYVYPDKGFLDCPIWHLLLDKYMDRGKIVIYHQNKTPLLSISEKDGLISCHIHVENKTKEEKALRDRIGDALYRCGFLMPENWYEIASKLSQMDDIVVGIDTNILYNCTISKHLLPTLSLIDPMEYVHTPNWIMLIIPSAVMHELEEAANIREENRLLRIGRMGFRALQEIIELNQSIDIEGVSLLIVGEANPVLDTRVELQGLRLDFCKSDSPSGKERRRKSSSGDMIIRDQFKNFLRQLDFHKGIYFLTADKSNAALARAEGLHPVYFKFPSDEFNRKKVFQAFKVESRNGEVLNAGINASDVIYEMAVEFGALKIGQLENLINVRCDNKGETLDYWIYRCLNIPEKDFEVLLSDYKDGFSLSLVNNVWAKLVERFIGLDEL